MALTLKGEAAIGGSINTRTELHGEDHVMAMDIPVQLLIKRNVLCKLLREDLAVQSLFNEKKPGHFEPLFGGKIGWIPLVGKYKESSVTFTCGVDEKKIEFENCSISKLKIDPQIGGMTAVKLTVQTEMNEVGKDLFDFAGGNWPVEIKLGKLADVSKEDQMELPMGGPVDDESRDANLAAAIKKDEDEQEEAEHGKMEEAATGKASGSKKKRIRPSRSKTAIAERQASKGVQA